MAVTLLTPTPHWPADNWSLQPTMQTGDSYNTSSVISWPSSSITCDTFYGGYFGSQQCGAAGPGDHSPLSRHEYSSPWSRPGHDAMMPWVANEPKNMQMTAWLLLLLLLLCGSAVVMVVTLCRCRRLLWYKYDDWLVVTPRTCHVNGNHCNQYSTRCNTEHWKLFFQQSQNSLKSKLSTG